jgi:raffinose/stachyose/melibiose transport system substrate-binding protein
MNATNTIYRSNSSFDKRLAAGTAKFDSAQWREAHQRIVDWGKAGYFDPKISLGIEDFGQTTGEFQNGRAAFMINGSWNLTGLRAVKGLSFGFAGFPGGPAGSKPRGVLLAGRTWAVSSQSKVQAAAKTYVRFWAESIDTYLKNTGGSFASLTTAKKDVDPEAAEFAQAISDGRSSDYFIANWNRPALQDNWYKILQTLLLDGNVDAAVKALDAEYNRK